MKAYLALAVVGLFVAAALAHGGGGGGGRGGPFGGYGGGWNYGCPCNVTVRTSRWSSAVVSQCNGNTGNRNIACSSSGVAYFQCVDSTCSVQTCGTNQIFNRTTLTCQTCPTGMHVDALNKTCVCNQGTTLNRTTGACVACPALSTQLPDKCYCDRAQYAFDSVNYACKACPAGSLNWGGRCRCNDNTQIFALNSFTCTACPVATTPGWFGPVCVCPAGQVLNKYTATCVTCPAGTFSNGRNKCRCSSGLSYDARTNTCVAAASRIGDSSSSSGEFFF